MRDQPNRAEKASDDAGAGGSPVRLALTIAYHGRHYAGWQRQHGVMTVQQRIEEALAALFPSKPAVHGSSRTDTGVHAQGLVAHFDVPASEWRMAPRKLVLALNAHLPEDVRIMEARRWPPGRHARFDAGPKEYRYRVWAHAAHHPLWRETTWHVTRKLDLAAMRRAAASFIGRHDFRAFSTTPGYPRHHTIRTMTQCEVSRSGPLLTFRLVASGFLYRMCRGIVGTLVQVGSGRIEADAIPRMLAAADRSEGGMTAPPEGLVLWKVTYPTRPGHPKEDEAGDD